MLPKIGGLTIYGGELTDMLNNFVCTINFLNIRTPKTFVVIALKFKLCGSTIE